MRIVVVVGTRPDAVKMAPVIQALRGRDGVEAIVVSSGQHREMLTSVLNIFQIVPDYDLGVMRPGQSLSGIASAVMERFDALLQQLKPDWVLVHGDTTTAMAAAVTAFHHGIRVGHVEAGLRTGDLARPFPEEFNRRCIDTVADILWAPTPGAEAELARENLPAGKRVLMTGNTVIDALLWAAARIDQDPHLAGQLAQQFSFLNPAKRLLLVTGHRRESFGEGFRNICAALSRLAARPDLQIVYPVHLNPQVSGPVHAALAPCSAIHLVAPQDYLSFVYLMRRSHLILTDSGGIQEEGPSLGKPVLVMRDVTERPEAVAAGTARLVGTGADAIVAGVAALLDDAAAYRRMAEAVNPYGDGLAGARIVASLLS